MWETYFDTKNEKTYFIVFDKGLWFGKRMRKSLVNPNQFPEFGVMVCDDTTDTYRSIGIDRDEIFASLHMKGTTCDKITQDPTN